MGPKSQLKFTHEKNPTFFFYKKKKKQEENPWGVNGLSPGQVLPQRTITGEYRHNPIAGFDRSG